MSISYSPAGDYVLVIVGIIIMISAFLRTINGWRRAPGNTANVAHGEIPPKKITIYDRILLFVFIGVVLSFVRAGLFIALTAISGRAQVILELLDATLGLAIKALIFHSLNLLKRQFPPRSSTKAEWNPSQLRDGSLLAVFVILGLTPIMLGIYE
jgi:hypothetical protein